MSSLLWVLSFDKTCLFCHKRKLSIFKLIVQWSWWAIPVLCVSFVITALLGEYFHGGLFLKNFLIKFSLKYHYTHKPLFSKFSCFFFVFGQIKVQILPHIIDQIQNVSIIAVWVHIVSWHVFGYVTYVNRTWINLVFICTKQNAWLYWVINKASCLSVLSSYAILKEVLQWHDQVEDKKADQIPLNIWLQYLSARCQQLSSNSRQAG